MLIRTNRQVGNGLRLVAIDPGKATGLAIVDFEPPAEDGSIQMNYRVTELAWPREAQLLTDHMLMADVIVCEDWRLRPGKAKQVCGEVLWGDRCAGFVEGFCVWQRKNLMWQQPAEMASFREYIKEVLNEKGSPWPKSEHAQDALIHAFVWLTKGEQDA